MNQIRDVLAFDCEILFDAEIWVEIYQTECCLSWWLHVKIWTHCWGVNILYFIFSDLISFYKYVDGHRWIQNVHTLLEFQQLYYSIDPLYFLAEWRKKSLK